MLRFFHIADFVDPIALEISDPNKQAYQLGKDLSLTPVPTSVLLAAVSGGQVQWADIFVINISNVTFAVHGEQLPKIIVQALEPDIAWEACDLGGAPEPDWDWHKVAAKAALLAWIAAQRRHIQKHAN